MSEENFNDQHLNFVRTLYSESLKLLKEKSIQTDVSIDSEKYTSLRFDLQKLGFASIYNLKKCTREGLKIEDSVLNYMEKRFQRLNDSIHSAYQKKSPTTGFLTILKVIPPIICWFLKSLLNSYSSLKVRNCFSSNLYSFT